MSTNKLTPLLMFSLLLLPTISSCGGVKPDTVRKAGGAVIIFIGGATGTKALEDGYDKVTGKTCPTNVMCDNGGREPAPGYEWVDEFNPKSNEVRWKAGLPYDKKENPNIVASNVEKLWIPNSGYKWSDSEDRESRRYDSRLEVIWSSGLYHDSCEHIESREVEDRWYAQSGYTFVSMPEEGEECPTLEWTPGESHGRYSHVVAAYTEGYWIPERGYMWASGEVRNDERRCSLRCADDFEVEPIIQ